MITKAASARPSTSSSNCRRRSGSSWPNCASSKKRSSRASSSGRRTAMPAKLERSSNPFLVPKNSRGPVALPCPNRPFSLTEPKVSQRYQLSSANQSINQSINQPINQLPEFQTLHWNDAHCFSQLQLFIWSLFETNPC